MEFHVLVLLLMVVCCYAGDDEKYINLTTVNHNLTTTAGTPEVQWVVDVLAYPPSVHMTWFSPDNRSIRSCSKYSINSTSTRTTLKIYDVSIRDMGIYRLLVMNEAKGETLLLRLIVNDKPVVTLTPEPEIYYNYEKSYEINCEVIGYPKPDIQWSFEVCDNPPNCNSQIMPVSKSKISKEWQRDGTYISSLIWKASKSGYLTCRANNSEGSTQETRELWVTDVLHGFHLEGKSQAVAAIEEDNITMNCGASKYNSKVQWFLNSTDRLISDYKLPNVVLSTKITQFSYQSILTITNITITNNGFYFCSATASGISMFDHVKIEVQAKQKPQIISNGMDDSTVSQD